MNLDSEIKQCQLRIAKHNERAAEYEATAAFNMIRPSCCLPCTIKRDGSRWLCILESSPDVMECPMAYGESPAQAMLNFDHLWLGAGIQLDDPYDDYTEEF